MLCLYSTIAIKTAHMRKDELRMLYRGDVRSEFLSLRLECRGTGADKTSV